VFFTEMIKYRNFRREREQGKLTVRKTSDTSSIQSARGVYGRHDHRDLKVLEKFIFTLWGGQLSFTPISTGNY